MVHAARDIVAVFEDYECFKTRLQSCILICSDLKNIVSCCFVFLGSGKYLADKQENCLRLFALQAIGADAMRKVFVNPADFEEKKNNFKKSFSKDNEKLKLLSGKYEFFLVYKFIIIFAI